MENLISLHWLWGALVTLGVYVYKRDQKESASKLAVLDKRVDTVGSTLLKHAEKHVRHEEGQKHLTQAVEELKASMEKNTDKLTDIHNLLCKVTGSLNIKE